MTPSAATTRPGISAPATTQPITSTDNDRLAVHNSRHAWRPVARSPAALAAYRAPAVVTARVYGLSGSAAADLPGNRIACRSVPSV
jgi:hypothetical protein